MNNEAMRAAFEAWFLTLGYGRDSARREGEFYTYAPAALHWKSWKAATAQATAAERERCMLVCENMTAGSTRAEISDAIRKGETLDADQDD